MYYMGIDLHTKYFKTTIMDAEGKVLRRDRVSTDRSAIASYLGSLDGKRPEKAVMEACYSWPYLYDQLEGGIKEILLAHPQKTRAIAEARIKNDTLDADTLAHLLRSDLIVRAYAPPKETRDIKNLLRYRASLVSLNTSIKNRVHAVLWRNHVEDPCLRRVSDIFGKKGMASLRTLKLYGYDTAILEGYLDLICDLKQRIGELGNRLRALNKKDPIATLITTIPGLGDVLSLMIRWEIDDIERFPSPKKLCSYAGLVPSTYSSGGKCWHGRITKQGNRWLRWAIIEAAHKAPVTSPSLASYHAGIKARRCANDATVALSRKLLGIVYGVWKEERPYFEGSRV